MTPVILPWLVEIAIISWRSLTGVHFEFTGTKQAQSASGKGTVGPNLPGGIASVGGMKRPPLPSEILPTFLIFGIYAMIAEKDARVGQLLAWGTVLATGLLMFSSKAAPGQAPAGQTTPGTFPPGQFGPFTQPTPPGPNYPAGQQTPGNFRLNLPGG